MLIALVATAALADTFEYRIAPKKGAPYLDEKVEMTHDGLFTSVLAVHDKWVFDVLVHPATFDADGLVTYTVDVTGRIGKNKEKANIANATLSGHVGETATWNSGLMLPHINLKVTFRDPSPPPPAPEAPLLPSEAPVAPPPTP